MHTLYQSLFSNILVQQACMLQAYDFLCYQCAYQVYDMEGRWSEAMGLPLGSAVLVRPDGHVAWRHVGLPAMGITASVDVPVKNGASESEGSGKQKGMMDCARAGALITDAVRRTMFQK